MDSSTEREAAAASARPLPPLPPSHLWVNPAPCATAVAAPALMVPAYTAEQVNALILADRADSAPQAVRMLTDEEALDCECSIELQTARAIQRKFCEVNGLVPEGAPHDR